MESDLTTVVNNIKEEQKAESAVRIFAELLVSLIEENNKNNKDTDSIKELLDNT
ncbi:MAG: hypothetical protein PHS54_03400 [Clostridia bacterium]|jgi:hypothetical protein|nr:hypothetical protein [Clostridia bacterium]